MAKGVPLDVYFDSPRVGKVELNEENGSMTLTLIELRGAASERTATDILLQLGAHPGFTTHLGGTGAQSTDFH